VEELTQRFPWASFDLQARLPGNHIMMNRIMMNRIMMNRL
jgi:hypothetical protein